MTTCIGKSCAGTAGQPRPTIAHMMLCTGCTRRLEQHLAEMPARLHLVQALHDGRQSPRRSDRPGGDAPVPVNVDAFDLLQAAPAVLGSWVLLVCEERSLRGPDNPENLAAWLLGQLDWLVRQLWVDDMAEEVSDLARAAERLCRVDEHRHRLEPPCPSCSARELGRWDGTEQVDCGSCGRVWPEKHYRAFVRLALDDSGGCLTAGEAAVRLGVSVGTVRNYVTAGEVRKLGTVDGTARYSTQDVERLAKQQEGAA